MKKVTIGNLVNLKSFEDAEKASINFKDDASGTILARHLEAVDPTIFKQQYAGLTFLQNGITVNNNGGWAEFITKIKRNITGDFSDGSGDDKTDGKISVGAESDSIPVYLKEAFSEWSDAAIKQADLEGRNLVSELIEAHNELYNRNIDAIGYVGQLYKDGSQKTDGLLNFSGFDSGAGTMVGTGSATDDYNQIKNIIVSRRTTATGNDTLMPTNVTMPTRVFEFISGTILNTAGTGESILEALQRNYPSLSFGATSKAEFASQATAAVKQVDTITLATASESSGETFTATINTIDYVYTTIAEDETAAIIATGLAGVIGNAGGTVSISDNAAGVLTLTSTAAGTAVTIAVDETSGTTTIATANVTPNVVYSNTFTSTVCYSANERAMVMRIPTPLEIGEIIKTGSFKFQVDSRYRIAGLDVVENSAAEILTGL